MDYILPAGIYCKFVKELRSTYQAETVITTEDVVTYETDDTTKA
jgi:hypothetical protein